MKKNKELVLEVYSDYKNENKKVEEVVDEFVGIVYKAEIDFNIELVIGVLYGMVKSKGLNEVEIKEVKEFIIKLINKGLKEYSIISYLDSIEYLNYKNSLYQVFLFNLKEIEEYVRKNNEIDSSKLFFNIDKRGTKEFYTEFMKERTGLFYQVVDTFLKGYIDWSMNKSNEVISYINKFFK